jgi:DNA-binding MarR family transcriptional regulator
VEVFMAEPHEALDAAMGRFLGMRGVLDPSQAVPGLGISMSEAMALRQLSDGALTQRELGAGLSLEKSTVSRLVDGMVRKGWAEKARDPDNRRYQIVRLTRDGRKLGRRVADAFHSRHARWFDALTPREQEALTVGLTALLRAIEAEPDPPA